MSKFLVASYTGDSGAIAWKCDIRRLGTNVVYENLRRVGQSRSLIETVTLLGTETTNDQVGFRMGSPMENGVVEFTLTCPDNTKFSERRAGQAALIGHLSSTSVAAVQFSTNYATTQLTPNQSPAINYELGTDKWDADGKTGTVECRTAGNYLATTQIWEMGSDVAAASNY